MSMRKLATIVLGLFLTSALLGAIAPHCMPSLEENGASGALVALSHDSDETHHHPGELPDKQDCVIAGDLTPGSVVAMSALAAPKLKASVVLWPVPSPAEALASTVASQKPPVRLAARASPSYSAAFARTGRLLI